MGIYGWLQLGGVENGNKQNQVVGNERKRERDGKKENNGNHCMMASKRGYGKRDKKQIGQREQANAEKDVRHLLATERLWKQE